jgi:hypothetical protein
LYIRIDNRTKMYSVFQGNDWKWHWFLHFSYINVSIIGIWWLQCQEIGFHLYQLYQRVLILLHQLLHLYHAKFSILVLWQTYLFASISRFWIWFSKRIHQNHSLYRSVSWEF